MLFAVDIGNTTITCGLFRKNSLVRRFSFATRQADYYTSMKKGVGTSLPEKAIVSSVVPKASTRLHLALRYLQIPDITILGKDRVVPVPNRYRHPKQVGQDRLVNAYAAIKLYGSPAVVVDFGTAITFDVISAKSEYIGGMILPGIGISLSALAKETALLPKVKLGKPPAGMIGKTTEESILSGVIFGFAGLTDGLLIKLRKKLGPRTHLIGTGGNIDFIARYCNNLKIIDIDLTLKGLQLISDHPDL
ncbi:MAG: type III pantothenate kinase [Candidatus Omnitrophica bacterium]|nr:type III pantothenate kinase [Candidatus Omnitrophota bacterium]